MDFLGIYCTGYVDSLCCVEPDCATGGGETYGLSSLACDGCYGDIFSYEGILRGLFLGEYPFGVLGFLSITCGMIDVAEFARLDCVDFLL